MMEGGGDMLKAIDEPIDAEEAEIVAKWNETFGKEN